MLIYENDVFIYNIKNYDEFIYFHCKHKQNYNEWSAIIYDTERWLDDSEIIYQEKNDDIITIQIIKRVKIINIKIIKLHKHQIKNAFMSM